MKRILLILVFIVFIASTILTLTACQENNLWLGFTSVTSIEELQEALENESAKIKVEAGTYDFGNQSFIINKQIELVGDGEVIFTSSAKNVIMIKHSGVKIKGLTIQSTCIANCWGIDIDFDVVDVLIENNTFTESDKLCAVYFNRRSSGIVKDNTVEVTRKGISAHTNLPITIKDNVIKSTVAKIEIFKDKNNIENMPEEEYGNFIIAGNVDQNQDEITEYFKGEA